MASRRSNCPEVRGRPRTGLKKIPRASAARIDQALPDYNWGVLSACCRNADEQGSRPTSWGRTESEIVLNAPYSVSSRLLFKHSPARQPLGFSACPPQNECRLSHSAALVKLPASLCVLSIEVGSQHFATTESDGRLPLDAHWILRHLGGRAVGFGTSKRHKESSSGEGANSSFFAKMDSSIAFRPCRDSLLSGGTSKVHYEEWETLGATAENSQP